MRNSAVMVKKDGVQELSFSFPPKRGTHARVLEEGGWTMRDDEEKLVSTQLVIKCKEL